MSCARVYPETAQKSCNRWLNSSSCELSSHGCGTTFDSSPLLSRRKHSVDPESRRVVPSIVLYSVGDLNPGSSPWWQKKEIFRGALLKS